VITSLNFIFGFETPFGYGLADTHHWSTPGQLLYCTYDKFYYLTTEVFKHGVSAMRYTTMIFGQNIWG